MLFTERLGSLLADRGWSVYKLSKECGVSESLLGYWRRGEKTPTIDKLTQVADCLDVSLDYLLGRTDENKRGNNSMRIKDREQLHIVCDSIIHAVFELHKQKSSKIIGDTFDEVMTKYKLNEDSPITVEVFREALAKTEAQATLLNLDLTKRYFIEVFSDVFDIEFSALQKPDTPDE